MQVQYESIYSSIYPICLSIIYPAIHLQFPPSSIHSSSIYLFLLLFTSGEGDNVVTKSTHTVSAAPYGSASILPISWMYIKMLGEWWVCITSTVTFHHSSALNSAYIIIICIYIQISFYILLLWVLLLYSGSNEG